MDIVYVAHTQSGVLMLDETGVCRWAVAHPGRARDSITERLVGAQYVATLDLNEPGGLVALPRAGAAMLFAATDPNTGRIKLVRTPPLMRFEDRRNGPVRKPLVSKIDEDLTPVVPCPVPYVVRDSSPPPSAAEPLPLVHPRHTPLPPSPRSGIAPAPRARIMPYIPPAPPVATGVQSLPVRVRSANMTLKRLARGK